MFQLAAVIGALLLSGADAYGVASNQNNEALSRRELGAQTLRNLVAGTAVANTLTSLPRVALAAADDEVEVYFGVGCFWHIQHEVRSTWEIVQCLACSAISTRYYDAMCLLSRVNLFFLCSLLMQNALFSIAVTVS